MSVTDDDHRLAARLAEAAGDLLMKLRETEIVEGKPLGALGDAVSNAFLVGALKTLRPDDGLLSEEEAADPARLAKSRVWIIDPLDGTREYSEGRPDWAVHVALAVDGAPLVGAVAMPSLGEVYSTAALGSGGPCANRHVLVSRSRPPAEAEAVAAALGGSLQGMGSAGAKAMAVLRGEALAYVHSGGQYEWDSCAPACVAAAHGLHVSRLDGAPLRYNQSDPYMPDLIICRPDVAEDVLKACAGA
ncbi:MAG: 3'(2'),5'-bisphosphate nucleotidase CysQ [Caulobacteraceae bacterium]|nr:3'(2'),5'-bisphosphate nucleotidase CysQ [Caulobacteraceae bacterium]